MSDPITARIIGAAEMDAVDIRRHSGDRATTVVAGVQCVRCGAFRRGVSSYDGSEDGESPAVAWSMSSLPPLSEAEHAVLVAIAIVNAGPCHCGRYPMGALIDEAADHTPSGKTRLAVSSARAAEAEARDEAAAMRRERDALQKKLNELTQD
jgi:hypothetical protein